MIRLMKDHKDMLFLIIHTVIIADLAASLYFQFDLHSSFMKWKSILYLYE
ncbi:hypothetical protein [Bacillus sp. EB600]|nr:hypothetical protein [Bacillus sp. EB600]MCQ6279487.1 hypothetical protein [Bacillus sp. EB600]